MKENVFFCVTSAINTIEYSQTCSALRNLPVKLQFCAAITKILHPIIFMASFYKGKE